MPALQASDSLFRHYPTLTGGAIKWRSFGPERLLLLQRRVLGTFDALDVGEAFVFRGLSQRLAEPPFSSHVREGVDQGVTDLVSTEGAV